ncbi:MAG TPA: relaxase/mobilization nuclease domain-containing protein [Ohtaekwangia sp.]|nr:relaxase/mobilization nuclease domain-containing protein [Ohtaekwangia sp.]
MTGSQVKGRSFRGALRYNQEKVAAGKAEVLDNSFVNVTERNIMKEVAMVRMQRPDLKKYFYHTSINFPKDENVSNELMIKIGRDYLDANGFNQHQYIMFRHHDASHPHFHILVNRIGYDGSVVTDSNDYQRSEKVLRHLEKKYNLTQVVGSRESKERGMSNNEILMMKRTNDPSAKVAMQIIIGEVLKSKDQLSTNEFISKLEQRGVKVLFNQASTGYVSGISYSYQGMVMQGSKLGNAFKWSTIKNIINYEQERDRERITKQMLDQNTPSINFEQVTNMLKQIEQTHWEVMNDMESFRTKHRTLSFSFTDHHSQLKLSEQHLQRLTEKLSEQLTEQSTRFSKYQKSSRLKRYLTPTVVGIISALVTNLICWIVS